MTIIHNSTDITRAYFTHNGQRYQTTRFRGGNLEIYRIESTGLEMFEGYACDVNMDLAQAAYDAFQKAPGQRWLFDAGSDWMLKRADGTWVY